MELYKIIQDYPTYSISTLGNVRNISSHRDMKQLNNKTTHYKFVGLRKNKKTHFLYIHRLVATAYIPNLENNRCVQHLDGNRENNIVDNLKWASNGEVMRNI